MELVAQPRVAEVGHDDLAGGRVRDQVELVDDEGDDAERRAEEAERVVDDEELEAPVELGAVDGVQEDGLLPAVALLEEVVEVEGRLLLDLGVHHLDGLAEVVVGERGGPVLADRAVQPHVEADRAFDRRVDAPVAALDAQLAPFERRLRPALLEQVLRHADRVHQRDPQAVDHVALELGDLAVRERVPLPVLLDQLVLVVAEGHELARVGHVEVAFLVHVHDPGVGVGLGGLGGVVQRARLEEGLARRGVVGRDHDLVHDRVLGPQVHPVVGDDFELPVRDCVHFGAEDDALHGDERVADLDRVDALRHEAHVDFRLALLARLLLQLQVFVLFVPALAAQPQHDPDQHHERHHREHQQRELQYRQQH